MKFYNPITASLCLCLCLVAGTSAFSQAPNPGVPTINYEALRRQHVATAVRIDDEIHLDGRLDEGAWKLAVPAANFTQRFPTSGSPATQPTEVRFLYDDQNIYVGA